MPFQRTRETDFSRTSRRRPWWHPGRDFFAAIDRMPEQSLPGPALVSPEAALSDPAECDRAPSEKPHTQAQPPIEGGLSLEPGAAAHSRITQTGMRVPDAYWQDRSGRYAAKRDYHCDFCAMNSWGWRKFCRGCTLDKFRWYHGADCECDDCGAARQ